MKKLTFTTIYALLAIAVLAQAPQGISHQAVIRDANNQLVTESPIGIQVSIIQGTPEGAVVYSETHTPMSNANGLISFVIGQGISDDDFSIIDWANGPYFIKTEADPGGGTNYTIMGTSQVMSVPYALYAQHVAGMDEVMDMLIDAGIYRLRDVEGNLYRVVRIGNQVWMAENLKTTHYRNGTPIEYPGDNNSAWQNNTSGAYAWFGNDIGNQEKYGALYNWHAVANASGLCPVGWRVPSDADWVQLINYLIDNYEDITSSNVGNKLKSCRQENSPLPGECATDEHPRWNEHETHHGTDDFDFSCLPGGARYAGFFGGIGAHAHLWSATQSNENQAWMRRLSFNEGHVDHWAQDKILGFSVRCIKN